MKHGATHNECNFKFRLKAKTVPIPVAFHNLRGYDVHILMQAMLTELEEIKIHTKKPGNLHLIVAEKS